MSRLVSSIYNQANADPPVGAEARRRNFEAMREAWQTKGLFAVKPDDVEDDWTRQFLLNVANNMYGRRRN